MVQVKTRQQNKSQHSAKLLAWYDKESRSLPWRYKADFGNEKRGHPDPYHVWLSEIMLQQTTVTAVIPYFHKFLKLWPSIEGLANAPLDDVLTQWAGLGYYARARNLHKCAQAVVTEFSGRFPDNEEGLLELPGIGPYTAAAIAAIAFDRRAVVVDGNVERVVSRLFQVEEPLPDSKPVLKTLADELTPAQRAGDYAQAMMDLGATICTPRSPSCLICPVIRHCEAAASGIAETLPKRKKKVPKPRREGACFFVVTENGYVLLQRRPDKGLLAKMAEIPGTNWQEKEGGAEDWFSQMPFQLKGGTENWIELEDKVVHVFTHFHLTLSVFVLAQPVRQGDISLKGQGADKLYWAKASELAGQPLPSVMQKVIAVAQQHHKTASKSPQKSLPKSIKKSLKA